jgi:hypothetical protein
LEWNRISQKGLLFALNLSPEVRVLHIDAEKGDGNFCQSWERFVAGPVKQAGRDSPQLVTLPSPFRFVITPIVDYVLELECSNPSRQIAVLIPELVERHWFHYFLHNQRAEWLRATLLAKGSQQLILVSVPWHIKA